MVHGARHIGNTFALQVSLTLDTRVLVHHKGRAFITQAGNNFDWLPLRGSCNGSDQCRATHIQTACQQCGFLVAWVGKR
ncbi:hypothetical protein SDC9_194957 [bioreactor metagenome]|uniref:Uncharacterized protein n=1 Tax=bioreactor metagenome TaxID=1076179 RepID=A0A645I7P8_9ZZZZ